MMGNNHLSTFELFTAITLSLLLDFLCLLPLLATRQLF